ncbi:RNA polymerase sigma factor [Nibribacter ruber]|uniref:RNA polymerase sigma factor n=1 Tax=Nibribacter ruber TaxID=2698458 RepID=A0A6P1P1F1_9BACT|nr:RNA polymerase sigma factor [Nibribacter ruber]QHL87543.1 RNA polymerase sigma factor [Nibribacter ruber]
METSSKTKDQITHASLYSDAEVVERVLHGEKELYEVLMRRHNQKLYRAIRSYLQEVADAEDAMQDTYLLAYERLAQLKNHLFFSTWLIRIGINVALGKLRDQKKLMANAVEPGMLVDLATTYLQAVNYLSPEQNIIRQEIKQELEAAIDRIPEKYRIVYILREVEGMSLQEVVHCLDISESNTRVRLHRAKEMLKTSLGSLFDQSTAYAFGSTHCDELVERVMQRILVSQ